jgi:hypothetical protein
MSRLAGISGFIISAMVASASRGSAQDLRALSQRLERQAAVTRQATAALREYDNPFRDGVAVDTSMIGDGAIMILARADIASLASAAARQADSLLRKVPTALELLGGAVVSVQLDTTPRRYRSYDGPTALVRYGMGSLRSSALSEAEATPDAIARVIEGSTLSRALNSSRTPFSRWNRGNLRLRQEDRDLAIDWSGVRLDILSSRSLLGPRCYRGEIAACSMLLGLTSVDDPVMMWYDSLARFDAVNAMRENALRVNRADTEECLRGNDAACGRALHSKRTLVSPPAGGVARDALTVEATRLGGEGAIERMLASRGTPAEALAAGARVPVDSVLRVWQRHVRGDSIGSEDLSFRMAVVALGWTALMFGLATRISRWR